jgi:hypothetical protein
MKIIKSQKILGDISKIIGRVSLSKEFDNVEV